MIGDVSLFFNADFLDDIDAEDDDFFDDDGNQTETISLDDALAELLGGGIDNLMFSDDEEDDC